MNYLTKDEIISQGIEFAGEVCFSGDYGDQVYTKEKEEGGHPINGLLYEKYDNGNIIYYKYYKDGIPNGQRVEFYKDGKVKSFCIMDGGTIDGEHIIWYENGTIKLRENCKYGLVLSMEEYDESGKMVREKKNLSENEIELYEMFEEMYKS